VQVGLRRAGGDAQHLPDLLMRVSFQIVHQKNGPTLLGQRVDGSMQPFPKPGLRELRPGSLLVRQLQRSVPTITASVAPQPVHDHRRRNRVNPTRKRRVAPELAESLKYANERPLREFSCPVLIAAHPEGEPEDPIDMPVIEQALRTLMSIQHPLYEEVVVHVII
jgi:hypothetical protein